MKNQKVSKVQKGVEEYEEKCGKVWKSAKMYGKVEIWKSVEKCRKVQKKWRKVWVPFSTLFSILYSTYKAKMCKEQKSVEKENAHFSILFHTSLFHTFPHFFMLFSIFPHFSIFYFVYYSHQNNTSLKPNCLMPSETKSAERGKDKKCQKVLKGVKECGKLKKSVEKCEKV